MNREDVIFLFLAILLTHASFRILSSDSSRPFTVDIVIRRCNPPDAGILYTRFVWWKHRVFSRRHRVYKIQSSFGVYVFLSCQSPLHSPNNMSTFVLLRYGLDRDCFLGFLKVERSTSKRVQFSFINLFTPIIIFTCPRKLKYLHNFNDV